MAEPDLPPQPERLEGTPHPRDTVQLIGQEEAEAAFVDAWNGGRLHHAWLLTGPRGVGKATLAWRIARFLLATPPADDGGMFAPEPPSSLEIAPDHPVAQRIAAGGEGRIRNVTRSLGTTGKLRKEIVADDIRALNGFFQMSAPDGGYRVVIVDDADQMNTHAANALLKMLEEPPARAVILLISHQPSGLLPTIRSRCRTLALRGLSPAETARALDQAGVATDGAPGLAALATGSVGGAARLALQGGVQQYREVLELFGTAPHMDRAGMLALAEKAAARGKEDQRDLIFAMIQLALARLARTGAMGQPPAPATFPGEETILARLAPTAAMGRVWADVASTTDARARHGIAVNLDPGALVLDTLTKIRDAAPR